MKKLFPILMITCSLFTNACTQTGKVAEQTKKQTQHSKDAKIEKVVKTAKEWQEILSAEEYRILREQGTERAFTGKYWDNKAEGTYSCSGCQLPLFESDTKFKSGTGWPSFYQPVNEANVATKADNSHGWSRVEVLCGRCDGHLGHVFEDGPKPTGLRYCINGNILTFQAKE